LKFRAEQALQVTQVLAWRLQQAPVQSVNSLPAERLKLAQVTQQDYLGCLLAAVCAPTQLQTESHLARLAFERPLPAQASLQAQATRPFVSFLFYLSVPVLVWPAYRSSPPEAREAVRLV
jgi:hypothetical protein